MSDMSVQEIFLDHLREELISQGYPYWMIDEMDKYELINLYNEGVLTTDE
ncbi:hypothetical protein [Dehalobacter sp. 14DCB1]|nr:hypothetical protein [Dehalobacter sp. 14DCB1]